MDMLASILKVRDDVDVEQTTSAEDYRRPDMYEQWPTLEFTDLTTSIFHLFGRETSASVSSSLLRELLRLENGDDTLRLDTEEQLKWCMQVVNHSLTLSFSTHREYETVRSAVRVYLHWLRALTDTPDSCIPNPLIDTPEKYFRNIMDALRSVFCRRDDGENGDVPRGLAVERQASEIEIILEAVRGLTHSASRKYRDEVWARSLTFVLNSADLLLAEPTSSEEMGMRVGARVVDTLFDVWLRAVLNEEIPSPTYWRTLSVLCKRWRHHVTVIESWARKLLAMTVLVCRKMYGKDYCRIPIHDESVTPFADLPAMEEEGEQDMLYHSWFNIVSLLDSPDGILTHDPAHNQPINGGGSSRTTSSVSTSCSSPSLPLCFFLAATAIQRMVDVFYGDNRVPIEFKESDVLIRKWTLTSVAEDGTSLTAKSDTSGGRRDDTLKDDGRNSFSSSVSGKDSRPFADSKKGARLSDRSGKKESTSVSEQTKSDSSSKTTAGSRPSESMTSASVSNAGGDSQPSSHHVSVRRQEGVHTTRSQPPNVAQNRQTAQKKESNGEESRQSMISGGNDRPNAALFVAHTLRANPYYPAWVGERAPKSERMLSLTMDWLLGAALARPGTQAKGDVGDDVISGLSVHSADGDDVPDAISPITSDKHIDKKRRRSIGSSSSSMAGDTCSLQGDSVFQDGLAADGVSAGRAAALAALTRIVCSKSTNERLPNAQLASFLATVNSALIEKDRLILCSLFYYGHSLFRLALPGVEAILPHFLFSLDILLIESSKLRLHPSVPEVEMRRVCLRALSSVVCWPTTFGMSKIPQLMDCADLKSAATTYLQLRSRIYKTLVFSLRNETDPVNLQLTLAMCTVLMEESCAYDLGLSDEQTREMVRITTQTNGGVSPEKGLCVSFVRGLVSAVCDRICRPEWAGDHSVSLAAIDVLNALSHIHPSILFSNKDVSTGSLIVASLCRFIETQLMKPPPLHSKDLHSTVVAAYVSISVWLNAAPILAECEGVLNTVAEAVQLGVTGSKKHEGTDERKSAAASKRVLEAAEYLLYSLFCVVGRTPLNVQSDERRLLYLYGPSAIDTTRFMHFLVNGDTLLSLHEASHIPALASDCPTVLYVRRSPMQGACVGVARLRPHPEGYRFDQPVPPTPMSAASNFGKKESHMSQSSHGSTSTSGSVFSASSLSTVSTHLSTSASSTSDTSSTILSTSIPVVPVATGSIFSGVSDIALSSAASACASTASAPTPMTAKRLPTPPPPPTPIGQQFVIPPEFNRMSCKLDTLIRSLESTQETDAILAELKNKAENPEPRGSVWEDIPVEKRAVLPKPPAKVCNSMRVLLYDMGLIDRDVFGSGIVYLDSGQSADFYRELHDVVDSCPFRSLHTAHLFYVKDGQRSAVDILDNALNIQNTCADFCGFLSGLGEGVEIGIHDTWTGHWSTAFSNERKPLEEPEAVDHYMVDGVTHSLWWADNGCEMAFLMPTERSLRVFKQDLSPPAASSRRSSNKTGSGMSVSSDDIKGENTSYDSHHSDAHLNSHGNQRMKSASTVSEKDGPQPYGGGGSSMGNSPPSRRTADLRVMLVWLERAEDMNYFPVDELLCACDDGGDRVTPRTDRLAHVVFFIYQIEPGIVQIRTKGSHNRFGEAGPLMDEMVVSLASLAAFVRLTILNINRRNVAEIENYQFTHTKRRQAIIDFGKKFAANLTYEDFLCKMMER